VQHIQNLKRHDSETSTSCSMLNFFHHTKQITASTRCH